MPLEFRISTGSPTPIYRQIVEQVRHRVAMGTERPGNRLPSVRALAEQLVINPNTVAKAYGELVRDGLLEPRPGRGYFVAPCRQIYSQAERTRRLEQALDVLISEGLVLGFSPDQIVAALSEKLSEIRAQDRSNRGKTNG